MEYPSDFILIQFWLSKLFAKVTSEDSQEAL